MASMPSTVCAGSSRAVSRVPGPPPRTSTLATTAASNTIAVAPEPSPASPAWPTLTQGISVMRLRRIMDTPDSKPITADHFEVRAWPADLPLPHLPGHLGPHEWRCHLPGRPDRRARQFSLPLRAAAGAALSGVPGRHLAGALRGQGAGVAGPTRDGGCRLAVRAWLLDGVRG